MRLVFWGTYDTGKPRVRILLRGLRENGVEVLECHADVWGAIDDKSQVSNWITKLEITFKWLLSYPYLIVRYLRLPAHDAVIVGYLGHLDMLVLWPFAKLRGVPIVWDAFLSLYNTVVEDRKLIGPKHPLAFMLYAWEWLSCRAADLVLLDTRAHADFFVQLFNFPEKKTEAIFVGVENEMFPAQLAKGEQGNLNKKLTVLFYGQFIPLHGIETIVQAAQRLENEAIEWVIIGKGQEEGKIRNMLSQYPLPKLKWIAWVPYSDLFQWIDRADVCLGIFGNSEKAALVIPNKVFQIISCGKPLITRESPAIHELLGQNIPGVFLVPPEDPDALAKAVIEFSTQRYLLAQQVLYRDLAYSIQADTVVGELVKRIKGLK